MRRIVFTVAVVAIALTVALSSPALASKKSRTPVTSGITALKVEPEELRIRVRALIRPTLGTVEEAADRIIRDTSDPVVRRGALRWKIENTTTLLSALLRNDPALALADAWGYVIQEQTLLRRPEAAEVYGKFADRAVEALEVVQNDFRAFAGSVQEDLNGAAFEASIRKWADANPIEGALFRRPSMDSEFAEVLAKATGKGGAFAALGSLEETTTDVMTRMDIYTMYLPRLARWEAELALDDVTGGIDAQTLAANFERITKAADRLATVAEDVPALVERERAAALEALRAERIATMKDLRGERGVILDAVSHERIAALQEIEAIAQRLLDRSGETIHGATRKELEALVAEVEAMRKRIVDDVGTTLNQVVDHAFVKALQLLLIAVVLGAVGAVLYARFLRG